MELILFSDLPNEVIEIIINIVRVVNLSNYHHNKSINFKLLLSMVKNYDCILTARFTPNNDFIPDSIIIYGEYSKSHPLKRIQGFEAVHIFHHPFELNVTDIRLPKGHYWKKDVFTIESQLGNVKYMRNFDIHYIICYRSVPISRMCFMSVDIELQEYIKRLSNNKYILCL